MLMVLARWRAQAIVVLLLMFLANMAVQAQSLPAEVSRAWSKTGLPDTSLSMVIEEVGGARLAALGSSDLKNPASVMKLLTTWSALSELGPDFVWRTTFLMGAKAIVSDKGVLSGPLYLRPSGDPLFLLQDLWRLMRELRLRGITEISDIVIDRSKFGDIAINPDDFDGNSTGST
jgi:serine-type D-Ala-D-Ala carboxypeptidase/endopeptidase (penicillin-binding protein 4)